MNGSNGVCAGLPEALVIDRAVAMTYRVAIAVDGGASL
jgi:phage shock protein PspC (stress-responsive transcriptional regulator)